MEGVDNLTIHFNIVEYDPKLKNINIWPHNKKG